MDRSSSTRLISDGDNNNSIIKDEMIDKSGLKSAADGDNNNSIIKDEMIDKSGLRSVAANEIRTPQKNTLADEENNFVTPSKIVDDVESLGMALGRATLSPISKVSGSPRSITEIMVKYVHSLSFVLLPWFVPTG